MALIICLVDHQHYSFKLDTTGAFTQDPVDWRGRRLTFTTKLELLVIILHELF
jgi:hypothetical protein